MSEIIPGQMRFTKVFTKDLMDVTFDIEGIDLNGKTLLCQVRETPDLTTEPVLEFSEDDGSLVKTIVDTSTTTVQFYKEAPDMDIPVLPVTHPKSLYHFTIVMFTDATDVQTIVEGTMDVVDQYTLPSIIS